MLSFKIWLQDPKHKLIFTLVTLVLIFVALFFGYQSITKYNAIHNRAQIVEKDAKRNNKTFSQLYFNEKEQTNSKGDVILTYDLYLKKPFINTYDLNTKLRDFVSSVQDKYNVNGNKVRAIGIRLYDRKITWDKGLQPRAIAFWSLQQEIANKEMTKDDKKNKNNDDQNIKQINGTTDNLTDSSTLSLPEQAWNYTIESTKDINYTQYDLTVVGFNQYDNSAVTKPLTDQEFSFWLKMKLYEKIIGSGNMSSAAMMYLNYDLGGNVSYEDFVTISKDFQDFDDRETKLGDQTDFYPNDVTLRQKLAIYRPQLLFYSLSNGQMISSRTEAQKQLIETQPKSYSSYISEHNKEAAKTTDKYGGQNYYYNDPFSAVIGPYKKAYPKFTRPVFSPNLQENSALFNKSTAPGQ